MKRWLLVTVLLAALVASARAQSNAGSGSIRGQVVDPSGAVVPNARVAIVESGKETHSVATGRDGAYELSNLPPGKYLITANAKGFATFAQSDVAVTPGQASQLNISLEIKVEEQKINVEEVTPQVDVNPASNASAIILTGKDLEALPDDPDELQADLEALAGPSVGPNGGQLYIDGFTAGQLPPKSSIREIRINQNPFSAEYDKVGYGRIEIFTKPGTDKFHGQVNIVGNDSSFNSRNPFLRDAPQEPYDSVIYMANVGGPINKKASFFLDFQRRNIDEIAVVDETLLGPAESISNPRTRTNIAPRIDYQLTPTNTVTARYQYYRDTWENDGIGGLTLAEAGYNTFSSEHTLQITDTQTLGTKAVNETRFQYLHDNSNQTPLSTAVGVNVLGNFTTGGSSAGAQTDLQDHYELQNYTSLSEGKHFIKFGGRLRVVHEVNTSSAGFNGSYTFSTYQDYLSLTPSQLSINTSPSGTAPTVAVTLEDTGLYVQDDWRVRPNLTLSGGLRFETQNEIHDHADWAPRLGFSWGIGGGGKTAPKTVLRAGFGLFYDRFTQGSVLNAERFNGFTQQQFVTESTTYQVPPPIPSSSGTQTVYVIAPNLHAPTIIQSAASLERQVTKYANVTLTYLNSRGVHELLSTIPNAPQPNPFVYPIATSLIPGTLIYQYSSEGVFRQNQLIANFNIQAGSRLSLHGYYSLNYANSDTGGVGSFPTDSHDLSLDYGRASFDIRDRIFFGGSVALPRGFRLSPFMIFNSGSPYNVTVGQDYAGDLQFNVRAALAPNPTGNCVSLTAACHYIFPTSPYNQVPANYLTGPNQFTLNLRLAKTFGFGPETGGKSGPQQGGPPPGGPGGGGGGGPRGGGGGFGRGGPGGPGGIFGPPSSNRRYNLTFSVNARNVLNRVNPGTPIGVFTSQNFGQSVSLAGGAFSSAAANRKLELQALFSF